MHRKNTVGIDIGSGQIKIVVARFAEQEKNTAGNKKVPHILGTGIAPSRGMRRGFVEDPKELAESLGIALRMAEKNSGIRIRRAEVSIGDIGLSAFTSIGTAIIGKADQEITDLDLSKANEVSEEAIPPALTQNKRIIHRIPVGAKIDGKAVFDGRPIGMKGSKLEIKNLFIACLEPHLSNLAKAIEANDVEILDIVASPFATSIATLSKSQKIAGCVLANIGAQTTTIIVYEDNMPISLETLPLGGNDITNDIALGLKISIEEAESIKIGAMTPTNVSRKKLDEIIEARLSDIFELIEVHLKKINKNHVLPAGIFLTGGGAKIAGIEDIAKDMLKLPAKVVSVSAGEKGKNAEPIWSLAYGLCLLGASNDNFGVESGGYAGIGNAKNKIFAWLKQFLP